MNIVICLLFAAAFTIFVYSILIPKETLNRKVSVKKQNNKSEPEDNSGDDYAFDEEQEAIPVKSNFENKLYYSGISKRFPFITREWYMIITFIVSLIIFIGTFFVTGAFSNSVIAGVLCALLMITAVYAISSHRFRQVDGQLIKFANLIENYSRSSSGDLVSLLRKITDYLDDPLYGVVNECCDEAAVTGDNETAILRMKDKIESPLFGDMINNLLISSRHESNYAEVIKAYRKVLRDHNRSMHNTKTIVRTARINVLVIVIAFAIILNMISGMVSTDIMTMLSENIIGTVIAGFLIVVAVIIIALFISIGRSKV